MVLRATIAGCGGYLPATRLSNDELAALKGLDTSDAWIRERTGIGFRHIAAPEETASDLGAAYGWLLGVWLPVLVFPGSAS